MISTTIISIRVNPSWPFSVRRTQRPSFIRRIAALLEQHCSRRLQARAGALPRPRLLSELPRIRIFRKLGPLEKPRPALLYAGQAAGWNMFAYRGLRSNP